MGGIQHAGADEDPIFQRSKPEQGAQKSTVLLWQFFLLPLLIVVAALAVFLLFGAFAGSESSPQELLEKVHTGGGNEKQQAAHQLGLAINDAYVSVQRGETSEPPFYADPAFQKKMLSALESAMDDRDEPTLQFLAAWLGKIQAAPAIPLLTEILYPDDGAAFSAAVRLKAAQALMWFDSRIAERSLVRIAGDEADAEVRATGLAGLARLGLPRMREGIEEPAAVVHALRQALDDDHAGSRLNAAVGLAVRGISNDQVLSLLRQSLSREQLSKMGVGATFQSQALRNACRAVGILGATDLRDEVELLTDSKIEGDDTVRDYARKALAALDAKEDENA